MLTSSARMSTERSVATLTQMSVLVVVPVVHSVLLERMLGVVTGRRGQVASCEAQSDGSSLRWSSWPGAVQW